MRFGKAERSNSLGEFLGAADRRTGLGLTRIAVELEPSSLPASQSLSSHLISPHVELKMAPHAGFDTDQIKDKARKDLLYLLEGVSKDSHKSLELSEASTNLSSFTGTRKEEPGS